MGGCMRECLFPKTESWQVWLVHDLLYFLKKVLRVSRNSFDSMYLYSWQAQTSPLFCGIIHLHSTQIRYVIPILELSEMKKKRLFAAGKTQNFQLNIICPLGLQNLAFFFFSPPPGLAIWQKDSYIQQREQRCSSSIACNKDNHSSRAVCI